MSYLQFNFSREKSIQKNSILPDTIQVLLQMDGHPVATVVELELQPHLEERLVVLDGLGDGHLHPVAQALGRLVGGPQLRYRFLL